MRLQLKKIVAGCPESIEMELSEIKNLSREFIISVELELSQNHESMKVDLQDAKNILFTIISRFMTVISENIMETKDLQELALRIKFEEEMGLILKDLKGRNIGTIKGISDPLNDLLKFSGDLKTTFDFIIYHPIISANEKYKKSEKKDIKNFLENLFSAVCINAGILGHSGSKTPTAPIGRTLIDKLKIAQKTGSLKGIPTPMRDRIKELVDDDDAEDEAPEEEDDGGS